MKQKGLEGIRVATVLMSAYPRISGTVQRGTALAIDAHYVGLGMQLRNEAIASMVFLIRHGGSQKAMDAAYQKYHYATQIIAGNLGVKN